MSRPADPIRLVPALALPLVALAGVAGCTLGAADRDAPLVARCTEAAAALEECGGEVPEGFFAACEHEPSEQSIAVIDELASDQCDGEAAIGSLGAWREKLFVRACTPVMRAGYLTNRYRNGPGRKLRSRDREALRPHFGNLVDRVTVHYDANINTRWSVAGRTVQYGNYTAQAYGSDVYITEPYRPESERQLALVAHEIQHSRQARRAGSLGKSLENYCREFYRADFSYEDNALEAEAYRVQRRILRCLRGGDCS